MPIHDTRDSFLAYLNLQNRLQGNAAYPTEWLDEQANDFLKAMLSNNGRL
jgi:hypothetical protein